MKNIYIVGGWCRDTLLGKTPSDIDYVAVGYKPEEFSHLQQVGKDFPVFLTEDGSELALARRERSTGQGYNDFNVETQDVSLVADLKRRDITINSIAYDKDTGKFIDPFNGQEDIKKRILRHTSDAFSEDPLRVLRIARLRAKLTGFWKIAPETKVLIYQMRDKLSSLTPERVWKEVDRALDKNPHIFFTTLFELGVLDVIFPSIHALTTLKEGSEHHTEPSVFDHTMRMLKAAQQLKHSKLQKLACLYHDIAKPYCYREYGNGQGHENPELVESFLDIQIPNKYKKPMLILIGNHIRIARFYDLKLTKQVKFFDTYKRNKQLLVEQINLFNLDSKHRNTIEASKRTNLNLLPLIEIFNSLLEYSPKQWIDSFTTKPKVEHIKQKILSDKSNIIKDFYDN